MVEARRAIEKQNLIYHESVAKGDLEGYAEMFADDGVVLWKGELIQGRDRIREWARPTMTLGVGPIIQLADNDVRDDLAYEAGIYTRGNLSGSYLTVWKKQPDGQGRIQVEADCEK